MTETIVSSPVISERFRSACGYAAELLSRIWIAMLIIMAPFFFNLSGPNRIYCTSGFISDKVYAQQTVWNCCDADRPNWGESDSRKSSICLSWAYDPVESKVNYMPVFISMAYFFVKSFDLHPCFSMPYGPFDKDIPHNLDWIYLVQTDRFRAVWIPKTAKVRTRPNTTEHNRTRPNIIHVI